MKQKRLAKIVRILFTIILLFGAVYLVGPRVETPDLTRTFPKVPSNINELNEWITNKEKKQVGIKPGNASQIIFNDSIPKKTKYSVVYLHGFSASAREGDPVHKTIAKALNANLYLPRLFEHGLEEQEPLLNFTAEGYWQSALESLAVAKQLGEKVIVMGTSTGATLALNFGDDPDIATLLLYSPNIEIFDPAAKLLSKPWGLSIARMVYGDNYHIMHGAGEEKKKYWTARYRLEAITHVQKLVDVSMKPKTFKNVTVPVFMSYFYKNDTIQDPVVSVSAMLKMFDQLGTPEYLKKKMAFPDAGDHVMTSSISTKIYDDVATKTLSFLNKTLK